MAQPLCTGPRHHASWRAVLVLLLTSTVAAAWSDTAEGPQPPAFPSPPWPLPPSYPPPPTHPNPPPPEPSHSCSIVLARSPPAASSSSQGIAATSYNASFTCSGATPVRVAVSCWLRILLLSQGTGSSADGTTGQTATALPGISMSVLDTDAVACSDGTLDGAGPAEAAAAGLREDWRVVVNGTGGSVQHLELRDSVLSGLPLSAQGPLLSCEGYKRVTLNSVALTQLLPAAAAAAGQDAANGTATEAQEEGTQPNGTVPAAPAPAFGAFAASGLASAEVDGCICQGVQSATAWACMLFAFDADGAGSPVPRGHSGAALFVRNSSFVQNSVVAGRQAFNATAFAEVLPPALASALDGSGWQQQGSPSAGGDARCTASGYGAVVLGGSAASVDVELWDTGMAGNQGGCGAGMAVNMPLGSLDVRRTRLDGNMASVGGGAVFIAAGSDSPTMPSTITIADSSSVNNNTAAPGDALAGRGGAVYVASSADTPPLAFHVTDDTGIANNRAAYGGALYVLGALESLTISVKSHVDANACEQSGGAVFTNGSCGSIAVAGASSASSNAAAAGDGGMLWCGNALGSVTVTDGSAVSFNTALQNGGAVSAPQAVAVNVTVSWNSSLEDNRSGQGHGGALYLPACTADVAVSRNSTVARNAAPSGSGGAMYLRSVGRLTVASGSLVVNNSAGNGSGGAVFASGLGVTRLLIADYSSVTGNTASADGGALYTWGALANVTVSRYGHLDENKAGRRGGALHCHGGLAKLTLSNNSTMERNAAELPGGAISAQAYVQGEAAPGGSSLTVMTVLVDSNSSVSYNTGRDGGAIEAPFTAAGSSVTISRRSVMNRNEASTGDGGALYLGYLDVLAVDGGGELNDNRAWQGNGGAACFVSGVGKILISGNSEVDSNAARNHGGAVYINDVAVAAGSTPVVEFRLANNSRVTRNRANVEANLASSGGALYTPGSVSVNLAGGSRLSDNTATDMGGAIRAKGIRAVAVSEGSQIVYNAAGQGGGALYSDDATECSLSVSGGSLVANNSASNGYGGALLLGRGKLSAQESALAGALTVRISGGSCVCGNSAGMGGGALCTWGRLPLLSLEGQSSLSNNAASSERGGAVRAGALGLLNVTGSSQVAGNTAEQGGGALYSDKVTMVMLVVSGSSSIGSNAATIGYGGALLIGSGAPSYNARSGNLTVLVREASSISSNTAGMGGGALHTWGDIDRLELSGGSAVYNNQAYRESGGAVSCSQTLGNMTLSGGSNMSSNAAVWDGGAVSASAFRSVLVTDASAVYNNSAGRNGGALYAAGNVSSLVLSNVSSLDGNGASEGGAVYVKNELVSLQLSNSSMSENSASLHGGAVRCTGNLTLLMANGSVMDGNTAGGRGGAVYATQLKIVALQGGSSISGNSANDYGGAIAAFFFSNVTVLGSNLSGNEAMRGGGGAMALGVAPLADATPDCIKVQPSLKSSYLLVGAGSTLNSNRALNGDGGALLLLLPDACTSTVANVRLSYSLQLQDASFSGNNAGGAGGALAAYQIVTLPKPTKPSKPNRRPAASKAVGPPLSPAQLLAQQQLLRVSIAACNFSGNSAGWGYGLESQGLLGKDSGVRLNGDGSGGAVYVGILPAVQSRQQASDMLQQALLRLWNCQLQVDGAVVSRNRAFIGSGGAFALTHCLSSIRASSFSENSAGLNGGALLAMMAAPSLQSPALQPGAAQKATGGNTTAGVWANAVSGASSSTPGADPAPRRQRKTQQQGAGSAVQAPAAGFENWWLAISDCTFSANSATQDGGALYVLAANVTAASSQQPAARASSGTVLLRGGQVTNNTALMGSGGALFASDGTVAALVNATLDGNQAAVAGGAVYAASDSMLLLSGAQLVRNTASTGPGGALAAQGCRALLLLRTNVTYNSARMSGGGVHADGCTAIWVSTALLASNMAGQALGPTGQDPELGGDSPATSSSSSSSSSGLGGLMTGSGGGLFINGRASLGELASTQGLNASKTSTGTAGSSSSNGQGWCLLMEGSAVIGNKAGAGDGGGAALTRCAAAIGGSQFQQNEAVGRGGGALAVELPPAAQGYAQQLAALDVSMEALGRAWSLLPKDDSSIGPAGGIVQAADSWLAATVSISNSSLQGNTAAKSGGGLFVQAWLRNSTAAAPAATAGLLQAAASNFTNNSALAGSGGGLYAAAATRIELIGVAASNNSATDCGGGVAADGCQSLLLQGSYLVGNRALLTGGGLFSSSCSQVVLEQTTVSGNTAAAGGGVHATATNGVGNASLNPLCGDGALAPSLVLLSSTAISNNSAREVAGGLLSVDYSRLSPLLPALAGDDEGGDGSYGGGLFLAGSVVAVLNNCSFSSGQQVNAARYGSAVATTQRCCGSPQARRLQAATGGSSPVAFAPPPPSPPRPSAAPAAPQQPQQRELAPLGSSGDGLAAAAYYSAWWTQLQAAAAARCWMLAFVGGTLLPLNRSTSGPAQQAKALIWAQDQALSALYANCSALSATPSDIAAATTVLTARAKGGDNGANAATTTTTTSILGIAGSRRDPRAGLINALKQCTLGSPGAAASALVVVPPMQLRLVKASQSAVVTSMLQKDQFNYTYTMQGVGPAAGFSQQFLDAAGRPLLQLRTGVPFDISIQFCDTYGNPAVADTSSYSVRMTLHATLNETQEDASDGLYANLVPGLVSDGDDSLLLHVTSGFANWTHLVARGWPGLYMLSLVPQSGGGNASVTTLLIPIELLPCSMGDQLDLEAASLSQDQASYTSCSRCSQGLLGLWRDARPTVQELATGPDPFATIQSLSGRLSANSGDATCRMCPNHARCPGGALLLPERGWWHSAANSTRLHRCPYRDACAGNAGDTGYWTQVLASDAHRGMLAAGAGELAAALNGSALGMLPDNRSTVLAYCQVAWYATWPPGAAVLQSYFAAVNGTLGPASAPLASSSSSEGTARQQGQRGQLQLLPCMLWYEPSIGEVAWAALRRHTYQGLQCAEGYTSNLCAACEAGYYVTSDFQCTRCPKMGRTVGLGLLALLASVLLVLYTVFANMTQSYVGEEDEQGNADGAEILKVLIVHFQYLVIISRLNIDYPPAITQCQSLLSAATGAENIAYSPACLWGQLGSAGQARVQLLAGFVVPFIALAISAALWAARYRFFRRALLQRSSKVLRRSGQRGIAISSAAAKAVASANRLLLAQQASEAQLLGADDQNAIAGCSPRPSGTLSGDDDNALLPRRASCSSEEFAAAGAATGNGLRHRGSGTLQPTRSAGGVRSSSSSSPSSELRHRQRSMPAPLPDLPEGGSDHPSLPASPPDDTLQPLDGRRRGPVATPGAAATTVGTAKWFSGMLQQYKGGTRRGTGGSSSRSGGGATTSSSSPLNSARSDRDRDKGQRSGAGAGEPHPLSLSAAAAAGAAPVILAAAEPGPASPRRGQLGGVSTSALLGAQPSGSRHRSSGLETCFSTMSGAPSSSCVALEIMAPDASLHSGNASVQAGRASAASSGARTSLSMTTRRMLRRYLPSSMSAAMSPKGAGSSRSHHGPASARTPAGGMVTTQAQVQHLAQQQQLQEQAQQWQHSSSMRRRLLLSVRSTMVRASLYANMVVHAAARRSLKPRPTAALVHIDQALSLVAQLGLLVMVAVFIFYPTWVQASLSIFACYMVDEPEAGTGQQGSQEGSSWLYGYWVRDMSQPCYTGIHSALYLPLGIVTVIIFCALPPLASFLLLWRVRHKAQRAMAKRSGSSSPPALLGGRRAPQLDPLQHDYHVRQVYGFLYSRYKPRYWWWESVLQIQTLAMVAVEVFGRALAASHQALMLLATVMAIACINSLCAPVRARLLVKLEFGSLTVLGFTIALGLYFAVDDPLSDSARTAIAAIILTMNSALVGVFLILLTRRLWPAISRAASSINAWSTGTRPTAASDRSAASGIIPPSPVSATAGGPASPQPRISGPGTAARASSSALASDSSLGNV